MNTDNTIIRQLEFELVRRPPKCRSLSYPSAHDNIASIKQSRPYLVVAQYSVDLVPIFLRDRNPSLLLLLLLLRLLFLVTLKAAMNFLPIVDHDGVTPLLALVAARLSKDLLFRAKRLSLTAKCSRRGDLKCR